MGKINRSTTFGALTAASLMAAGTVLGAGAAQADPEVTAPTDPAVEQYQAPRVNIGDPWGFGEIPLVYGNGAVCAGGANGNAPTEEIHITFRDGREKTGLLSLNPVFLLPTNLSLDVEWHNQDTGESGVDHVDGTISDAWSRLQPGVGNVTGTITATASILPGGGSVDGIGSHTIEIPFETYSKACES